MSQTIDSPNRTAGQSRSFTPRWPGATKWLFGPLLALDMVLLLLALSLTSVTATGPAQRALGHTVAILIEIDGYLDEHYESIRAEAQETDESTMTVADFPLAVTFKPSEIAGADRQQFRGLLLQRSAALLRDDGVAAFHADQRSEIDSISPQGAVRAGLDMLRPTPHRVFTSLMIAFAAIAALLTAALLLSTRGWGRVAALGVSLFVAAAPFLASAVALRFALRVAADGADEYVAREFLQLGQELVWAPIRDGVVASFGAGLLVIGGALLSRWSDANKAGIASGRTETT